MVVQALDIKTVRASDGSPEPGMSTSQNYNSPLDKTSADLGFTFDIPQFADVTSYVSELRYSGSIGTLTNKVIGCLKMKYTLSN